MKRVRIVQIPSGEAPEHIRKAWVGLTLPLAADMQSHIDHEASISLFRWSQELT
jgi:hypothetical protein